MEFRTELLTLISMLLHFCVPGSLHLSNTLLLFDSAAGSTGGGVVWGKKEKKPSIDAGFKYCQVSYRDVAFASALIKDDSGVSWFVKEYANSISSFLNGVSRPVLRLF